MDGWTDGQTDGQTDGHRVPLSIPELLSKTSQTALVSVYHNTNSLKKIRIDPKLQTDREEPTVFGSFF